MGSFERTLPDQAEPSILVSPSLLVLIVLPPASVSEGPEHDQQRIGVRNNEGLGMLQCQADVPWILPPR